VENAKVLVVGAGALGNEVIKNLVLMGIGHLFIVDFDTIEAANLSRSPLFRESDSGRKKAHVAAARAKELNPNTKVQYLHGDVTTNLGLGVLRRMDVLIGCLDNREARLAVNRFAYWMNKPWVDGAIQELLGLVRVFVPGEGACFECSLTEDARRDLAVRYSCPLLARQNVLLGKVPTTPTISSIIGAMQSQEALKILNGTSPDDIPVMRKSPNAFVFDYKVLKRFGVSPADLPEGSILINKPFSVYAAYKHLILTIVGAFIILVGLIVVMVVNITSRRQAEKKLRESEEKYRILIENADEAICVSQDGMIKFLNPKTEDMSGYSKEELLKIPFTDLVHPENRDMVLDRHRRRLAGEELPSTYSFRIINKAGETLWVQLNTVVIHWEGRLATLNFLRDITQLRKLEAQFQYVQRMESLGTLAGGIAHDFNNLLMGIQGNASLMLLEKDSGHPGYERLKHIEQYVRNGSDLAKQLLGFARGGKYEVRPTDMNKLIKTSSQMFGRTKKEIKIHRKYQEGIWTVNVDRTQIEQVLLNLYVNAWQAMPGGGELYLETENVTLDEAYVKPFQVGAGKYVKISITDTGVGMEEAIQQRIFEPFFTTKDMGRGTGLGLASAYGIIKNHGGFIDVSSKKGEGTTFNIYLQTSEEKVAEESGLSEEILTGTETVLLVDDEEMIVDVGKQLLEKMGYRVFIVRSGKEAIDIYREKKDQVDIVILDMIMPGIGGGETYERMKEINPNLKALLSSGYSMDGQAQEILNRGCDGFIQKPFNTKQLSRKLREILDKD